MRLFDVLPVFEVTIEAPTVILKNSQEEKVSICAKYTHGANVKGQLNVTLSTKYRTGNYWRAPYTVKKVERSRLRELL